MKTKQKTQRVQPWQQYTHLETERQLTLHARVGRCHVDVKAHETSWAHSAVGLSVIGLVRSDWTAFLKLCPLHAEVTWRTEETFAGVGGCGSGAAPCADVAGKKEGREFHDCCSIC